MTKMNEAVVDVQVRKVEKVFYVPSTKVERFEKVFAKLQKLSKKFDSENLLVYKKTNNGLHPFTITVDGVDKKVSVDSVKYEIYGSAISVTNLSHELIASIEYDKNNFATISKMFTDLTLPIETYIQSITTGGCDHCSQNRARKHLYVIRDIATGQLHQVGKSCAKEYMDMGLTPTQLENYYTSLYELENCGYVDNDTTIYNVNELIAVSIEVIAKNNNRYIPTAYGITSTAFKTKEVFEQESMNVQELVQKYETEIALTKEYFANEDLINESLYFFNINVCLQSDHVEAKNANLVISAYHSAMTSIKLNQKLQQQKEQTETVINEYYDCKVGEDIKVKGKIVSIKQFEGYYGLTNVVNFISDTNHRFTWFTSSAIDNNLVDKDVTMVAKVKKLEEYKEEKTVYVNYVKFTRN